MSPSPPLLDDRLLFVEVVTTGGITAAAERLSLRKSTVSRRLESARTMPVSGRLRVPSVRAGQAAARAGLGVVRLPASLVIRCEPS